MYVTNLEIKKQASYETNAGQLVGVVVLEDTTGKQSITLSSMAISKIFEVIASEVQENAVRNAKKVRTGMEEAIHSPLLLQASKVGEELC